MDSLTGNHNYFKPSLLVIELLRKAVIAQNRVASFTGFRMKRTIVGVNEGKHSLGGVSCSKQEMYKTRWLPQAKASWDAEGTDAKSGVGNSICSQQLQCCLGVDNSEGTPAHTNTYRRNTSERMTGTSQGDHFIAHNSTFP